MTDIKLGSKWRLIDNKWSHKQLGTVATIEPMYDEGIVRYTYDNSTSGANRLDLDDFLSVFEPVENPEGEGWDYAEADKLHAAARAAIWKYNEYIARKPDVSYMRLLDSSGRYSND